MIDRRHIRELFWPSGFHTKRWRLAWTYFFLMTALIAWGFQTQRDAIRSARALAVQVNAANVRQNSVIRLLCDRGYITEGALRAGINALVVDGTDPRALYLDQLRIFDSQLLDQMTDPESPCVKAP